MLVINLKAKVAIAIGLNYEKNLSPYLSEWEPQSLNQGLKNKSLLKKNSALTISTTTTSQQALKKKFK